MKRTSKKTTAQKKIRKVIYPLPIKEGECLGLVAPAGSLISKKKFDAGVQILEQKGFRVKFNYKLLNTKGYLAGADRDRADDFNRMWSDPEVKGLIAARGGYGSIRMIHLLDMKQIQKNPKILIGFSDLSVLINTVTRKTGLVTYHGPVVTTLTEINKSSLASFFDVLSGHSPQCFKPSSFKMLKDGNARGVLSGGNLTTLVHTIGTPYEIPWDKAILFIEDIGEQPYRLDRLLTHLSQGGRLQKIKGLILGTFTDDEKKENAQMQRTVRKRVIELLGDYEIPVWANLPVGHSRRNISLPIGVEVEMDSDKNILRFL